ncbi:MAG TPA: hypothetical protein VIL50_04020, partial [Candidatus Limnocylindrales bacterium]
LYNQSVKRLRSALLGRPHTVVVNVPYRREDPTAGEHGDPAGPGAATTSSSGVDDGPTGSMPAEG